MFRPQHVLMSRVMTRLQEAKKVQSKAMIITTFGATRGEKRTCNIPQQKTNINNGGALTLPAVVVPHIRNPVSVQPTDTAKTSYKHLAGLELADSGDVGNSQHLCPNT